MHRPRVCVCVCVYVCVCVSVCFNIFLSASELSRNVPRFSPSLSSSSHLCQQVHKSQVFMQSCIVGLLQLPENRPIRQQQVRLLPLQPRPACTYLTRDPPPASPSIPSSLRISVICCNTFCFTTEGTNKKYSTQQADPPAEHAGIPWPPWQPKDSREEC